MASVSASLFASRRKTITLIFFSYLQKKIKGQSYKFRSIITLIFSPTFRRMKHTQTDVDLATWGACMHPQRNSKRNANGMRGKTGDVLEGIPRAAPDVGVHGGTDPTSARHRHRQFVTHKKTQDFLITVYIYIARGYWEARLSIVSESSRPDLCIRSNLITRVNQSPGQTTNPRVGRKP